MRLHSQPFCRDGAKAPVGDAGDVQESRRLALGAETVAVLVEGKPMIPVFIGVTDIGALVVLRPAGDGAALAQALCQGLLIGIDRSRREAKIWSMGATAAVL